jgi:hypothetical protein
MSNNLALSQIAATQSNKHVTANDQAGQLDAALTEILSVEVDDTNLAIVLTEDFQRHAFFDVVDAVTPPDDAITVTVPAIKRGLFVVRNETAQLVTVEIIGQPETSPTVSAGEAGLLICDGVNVVLAGTSTVGSDEKVKVSANDTTPAYLIDKLVAGAGMAVVETDDGTNETVVFRAARLDAIRIYTGDDTWNKPANLDFVIVLVIGAGGGGGGCPTTGASEQAAAAGGGAGGYSLKKIAAASLGASETVTRGAGGAGGVGGTDGSTGGTSSFGAHCSATGGAGGQAGTASPAGNNKLGGLGGAGSGGHLDLAGGDGGNAAVNAGARMIFGSGAASQFGGAVRSALVGAGRDATVPGAGGSGGSQLNGAASAVDGGNGANGIVILWEYLK